MPVYNATRHLCTPEQLAAGIIDLPASLHKKIKAMSTFNPMPTMDMVESVADDVTHLLYMHISLIDPFEEDIQIMIGGAPYYTAALADSLAQSGYQARYPFFQRKYVNSKVVFLHEGLV